MHSTLAICMHLEFTLREFSCVSAQSEKFYKCQKHLCFSKEVYAGYTTVRQSQKLSWGLDEFEGLSKRSNFVGKHLAIASFSWVQNTRSEVLPRGRYIMFKLGLIPSDWTSSEVFLKTSSFRR